MPLKALLAMLIGSYKVKRSLTVPVHTRNNQNSIRTPRNIKDLIIDEIVYSKYKLWQGEL